MRTPAEVDEVCRIYNLHPDIARKYVQFGEVFNLLHAGASYLRTWQKGYGAVGVSDKYGKRSFARKYYPIFPLSLQSMGSVGFSGVQRFLRPLPVQRISKADFSRVPDTLGLEESWRST